MSNWSDTCAKMMKTLCDVTDYDDSDLPLLGVKADIDGSFENDFLRGHAVNKYNKLVPYKESGVTKDDIEKECARRGLGVGSTKTESIKILERSDKRDVSMFPEHLDLEDLAEDMPALIDTEEHKFSEMPFKEVVAILRQMRDAEELVVLDLRLPSGAAKETGLWLARALLSLASSAGWVDPDKDKEPAKKNQ